VNLELDGKKALVTGSTAGIGFAIAKALAAEGARVIVNGRTDARVNEAIRSIRAEIPSAKLEALALDLSKRRPRRKLESGFPTSLSWSTISAFTRQNRSKKSPMPIGASIIEQTL